MSGALLGAVSQGILWGIMVLGVYITYKLLDIADLTVDGSFALGGSVCAVLVVSGVDPLIAVISAMLAGMLAGAVTGFLHTVFEIPAILAGILTQIALWSVNLRIMGKSNTPLLQSDTIFSRMTELTGLSSATASIIVGVIVAVAIIAALAATEVDGVASMAGNITNELVSRLGMKNLSKGVKVDVLEGVVTVSLALNLKYNYSIMDVTAKVQDRVKTAIENMTGLEVADINIRVAGVEMENRE